MVLVPSHPGRHRARGRPDRGAGPLLRLRPHPHGAAAAAGAGAGPEPTSRSSAGLSDRLFHYGFDEVINPSFADPERGRPAGLGPDGRGHPQPALGPGRHPADEPPGRPAGQRRLEPQPRAGGRPYLRDRQHLPPHRRRRDGRGPDPGPALHRPAGRGPLEGPARPGRRLPPQGRPRVRAGIPALRDDRARPASRTRPATRRPALAVQVKGEPVGWMGRACEAGSLHAYGLKGPAFAAEIDLGVGCSRSTRGRSSSRRCPSSRPSVRDLSFWSAARSPTPRSDRRPPGWTSPISKASTSSTATPAPNAPEDRWGCRCASPTATPRPP